MKLINYKSPEGHVLSDFRINSWGHLKKSLIWRAHTHTVNKYLRTYMRRGDV